MDSIFDYAFTDLSDVKWAEKLSPDKVPLAKRPAGLIIDMQDDFCRTMPYDLLRNMINSQNIVIDYLKDNNLPLYVVKYDNSGDIVFPLNTSLNSNKHKLFEKQYNDAFYSENALGTLEDIAKIDEVDSFIIMGINATACVKETTISALANKYKVLTASDLIGDANFYSIPEKYLHWYGDVTSCFTDVYELLYALSREDKSI